MTSESPAETTGGRRPRDMVLSLLVLMVPIALVVLLFQYLGADTEVATVDPAPSIAEARRAGLDVVEPAGLPTGWKTTSAVVRRDGGAVTLRVGYVSPSGGFAQLVEGNGDAATLLRRELGGGKRPTGTQEISGTAWQVYPGRGNETALVLLEPERSILVLGTAAPEELRALAESLR